MSLDEAAGNREPGRLTNRGFAILGVLLVGLAAAAVWLLTVGFVADQEPVPEPAEFNVAPTGGPAPTVSAMPENHLRIPSIGIDADVRPGEVSAGALEIPSDPTVLTIWSAGAGACDADGTTLLAGHVINSGTHGALWPLHRIDTSAVAYLTCPDGTVTAWRVTQVQVTPKEDLPPEVFSPHGARLLAVVTCGGPVLPSGHYRDNVIAWFEPAQG